MKDVKLSVLIHNELKKMLARKLNTVLAAVLLAVTLMSLGLTALEHDLGTPVATQEKADEYRADAEDIKSGYEFYSMFFDDDAPAGLKVMERLAYADAYQFAHDVGILDSNDWRYRILWDDVLQNIRWKLMADQIDNGGEYADYVGNYIDALQFDYGLIKRGAAEYDKYMSMLASAKYSDYIKDIRDTLKSEYDEPVLSEDPTRAQTLYYDMKRTVYENAVYACDFIIDRDLDFNDLSAKQATNIIDFADDISTLIYVDEEHDYGDFMTFADYEQYLNSCEKRFKGYKAQLASGRFCLDNGIYDANVGCTSRKLVNGFFGSFDMLYIFALIVFGTVISSEFSAKTVNMLVIRPVSRTRIMLSKLVAACIAVVTVYAACLAVHTIGSVLITGGSDFFVPVTVNILGNIVAVAYPLHLLYNFVCCCLSAVMLGSFAFLISTLTKNAMAGVLIGMVSTAFTTGSSLMFAFIFGEVPASLYPLSHTMLWQRVDAGITCGSTYSFDTGLARELLGSASTAGDMAYGIAVCALLTALWVFCAVSCFKRRDIK